ncbi:MAG TPA: helix-turn-helix domain-containing protein [Acidiphilium sp.]
MLALLDQVDPVIADDSEAAIAKVAADTLAPIASTGEDVQLVLREAPNIVVPLPARAVQLILRILETMAARRPFSVLPHDADLTTQQAADYLNVSRPFLTRQIDDGKLKAHLVGRHRRVRFGDLIAYEQKAMVKQKAALAEMADVTRDLGLE